jgi:hypothetical protein
MWIFNRDLTFVYSKLLQGSPNLAFSHKNIKVKNFAVDIDYDMVWVGMLQRILLYMSGKRHSILQKKTIHRNY